MLNRIKLQALKLENCVMMARAQPHYSQTTAPSKTTFWQKFSAPKWRPAPIIPAPAAAELLHWQSVTWLTSHLDNWRQSPHTSLIDRLGFQGPMGPSTLAPAGSYIDTTKLIQRKGFKCIKPLNIWFYYVIIILIFINTIFD